MSLHYHDHCNHNKTQGRILLRALILTSSFMIIEAIAAIYTGSLTLLADSGHMLIDSIALFLSWFALFISNRPKNNKFTYGYHRLQVIATFVNAISLLVLSIYLAFESFFRFFNPVEIGGEAIFYVGLIGLLVNFLSFLMIRNGASDDINIKSALLHVLSDMLGSIAAIIAGFIIMLTGWAEVDAILSLLISVLFLKASWRLIKQSSYILMEGSPSSINPDEIIKEIIDNLSVVTDVHDIHIWSLTPNHKLTTLHVMINDNSINYDKLQEDIREILYKKFDLTHSTIQIETLACPDKQTALLY
ncbi:MAG: cation transporter [Sphingobacteriia bacterium]|nr:cation transporter [Sphingobacteriia bacterium]